MPFNPTNGTMDSDHAALQSAISEYGKAMKRLGAAGDVQDSDEYRVACARWGQVYDLLREHFRRHWFNAVG